jgi:hypothetical protein
MPFRGGDREPDDDDDDEQPSHPLLRMIFSRIICMCETKASEFLSKLDRQVLSRILAIIKQYREIFHFTDLFLENLERILSTSNNECLILNPFLEDLMEDNLYRFTRNGTVYLVPLWHHELVYDSSGTEWLVRCCPVLPEHMELDAENNLIVYLDYDIQDIWGKTHMEVSLGSKQVVFDPSQLRITPECQILTFPECGISHINTENVFDVTKKQSVVLHIYVSFSDEK